MSTLHYARWRPSPGSTSTPFHDQQIALWTHRLQAELPCLQEWSDYRQALNDATEAGPTEFVGSVQRGRIAPDQWTVVNVGGQVKRNG